MGAEADDLVAVGARVLGVPGSAGFAGDSDAVRRFAAALGFLGAVNLPVIHFSVRKWSGQHPQVVFKGGGGLHDSNMKLAFAAGLVTLGLLSVTLLLARFRLAVAEARTNELELEAARLLAEREEARAERWAAASEGR